MSRNTKELFVEDIEVRPTVLFDVDGVLNAYAAGSELWDPWGNDDGPAYEIDMQAVATVEQYEGVHRDFTIRWSSELADDILALKNSHDVNFVWLTSWDDQANTIADLLWPGMASPFEGYLDTHILWHSYDGKVNQVIDLRDRWRDIGRASGLAELPPIVHFDDMEVFDPRSGSDLPPYRPILTNPRYGITRTQWSHAKDLVAGWEAGLS